MTEPELRLSALERLEVELKLGSPEFLPLNEGNRILPDKIRGLVRSTRFVKRKDMPLLAYGLFCSDSSGTPYCYDRRCRKHVLDRIGGEEGARNCQIGRALVRGYFEVFATGSEYPWVSSFRDDVKDIVCSHPSNEHLGQLFTLRPEDLIELFDSGKFSDFLRRIGSGCLNDQSAFGLRIWQRALPFFIRKLSADTFRPNIDAFWEEMVDMLFFEGSQRLREPSGCVAILEALMKLLNAPFRSALSVTQKGRLYDLAGWIEADNLRLGDLKLNEIAEKLRHLVLHDPRARGL